MYQIKCDRCGKTAPGYDCGLPPGWIIFHTTESKQIHVCDWICLANFAKDMMADPTLPRDLQRNPDPED